MTSLTLPFPPRDLNPNRSGRFHWGRRSANAAMYRTSCGWAAKAFWGSRKRLTPPVTLAVTFVVADNRRRDMDNLIAAFKPGMDGLVDAGMIPDDRWQGLSITYLVERGSEWAVRVDL